MFFYIFPLFLFSASCYTKKVHATPVHKRKGRIFLDNQTIFQFFEWSLPSSGLHWRRTASQATSLFQSGIDIVWLPPAYKGAAGGYDEGYGVYDTYDLGEFEQKGSIRTKYGTREEYLAAIQALQEAGISVLGDIVLNQRMGADQTEEVAAEQFDPENRLHQISGEEKMTAWTKFTFPGRNGVYSPFIWNWTCFTGIDWDENTHSKGIYRFAGKEWSPDVDQEHGNYDYLMGADVDMESPYVVEELKRWGKWYVETTGINGFRLDALKHISYDFYNQWLDEMREQFGENLFTVGEYWSGDLHDLTEYLSHTEERMSLFDVPLHFNFQKASHAKGNFGMQKLLNNSLVSRDWMHTVTFVDNHDTQAGQSLESQVESWFKPLAYAIILLRKDGLPCIFYPDYYGLRSEGIPPVPNLKTLLYIRRHYAYGDQHDYFDHDNLVGFTREGDHEHPHSGVAVLMSDGPGGEKRMYLGRQFAGETFWDASGRESRGVFIQPDGSGTFFVPGGAVTTWVSKEAYDQIYVNVE